MMIKIILNKYFLSKVNGKDAVEIMRFQLEKLYTQNKVDSEIINVWCSIVNYNEQFRDSNSPARFFFKLSATECLVHYEIDSVSHRNAMFCEVVEKLYNQSVVPKKDIQLFFFPVYERDHYYLVCFNTTTQYGNIEVIDYSEDSGDHTKLLKHLRSAFCNFMQYGGNVQSSVLSSDIKRMEYSAIDSPWKSTGINHLHYGIALMRLMETYMGLSKWPSGLKKNNESLSYYMECP
ncbi:uncharacterized protein LOC110684781 [Chenopodium quinoa]|uniref:uncharacterized protein LOC110684781 n=1 Tax=Chenopodium quinoa TaxID=63459 RepID=UPI000B773AEA|nr:uncharacterized protein LOC110684781 [Chenopodium quinoa]